MSSPSAHRDRDYARCLERVLESDLAALGFELVAVEYSGNPKRRIVRVFLDKEEGVKLDDCARMSPIISACLDAVEADPEHPEGEAVRKALGARYDLEVSSPGVERPLARRRHFEAHRGARIVVQTFEALDPETRQRKFHGHILDTEAPEGAEEDPFEGAVRMRELDSERELTIPLREIRRAHLVFEA